MVVVEVEVPKKIANIFKSKRINYKDFIEGIDNSPDVWVDYDISPSIKLSDL